jgi:hypothetical protein
MRNVFFSRLSGHEEKGARINKLRNSIYYFLSLDPHEPDYKDITFSREDGILAINITRNFIANMLRCIS